MLSTVIANGAELPHDTSRLVEPAELAPTDTLMLRCANW